MYQSDRYLLKNCIVCGNAFRTSRFHAEFCSGACRQKNYRQQKKKAGQGGSQGENVTGVTLSYLDWLVDRVSTMPVAEDWQND